MPNVPSIVPEEQSVRDRRRHEAEAAAMREADAEVERAQRAAEEEQSERDKRREAETQARRAAEVEVERAQREVDAIALEAARVLAVKEAEREKSRPSQPMKDWVEFRKERQRQRLESRLDQRLADPLTCSAAADIYQPAYDAAIAKGSDPRKAHEAAIRRIATSFELLAPAERREASANSDDKSKRLGHALLLSAFHGRTVEAERLLKHDANANYSSVEESKGKTALHYAASQKRPAVVKLLLEWGANPNAEDADGCTPLDYVGDHDQIERLLLQAGAEPCICEEDEEDDSKISEEDGSSSTEEGNALVAAAVKGDVGEIRRLVDFGISANARNFSGNAALHFASARGLVAVARCLLDLGADVDARDRDGFTPLAGAKKGGHPDMVALLRVSSSAN